MKHIKSYKLFESSNRFVEEIGITLDQVQDIFINVRDCGLEIDDIHIGNALSIGDKEIVTDHNDLVFVDSYRSFSIRLKSTNRHDFHVENDLFDELKSSIGHIESEFNLQLGNIYLRTFDGVWFNNVDTMEKYINELPFAKKASLKWISYLDLTFKIKVDSNEYLTEKYKNQYSLLKSILNDVKDILTDLTDDNDDLNYNINFNEYYKIRGTEYADSIDIELLLEEDIFYIFNEDILPTLKKLESFLKEYDLNIDIELVNKDRTYSLDEFVNEHGDKRSNELIIIIIY